MTSQHGHAARTWALRAFVVLVPAILMARATAAPPDPAAAPSPPVPAHSAAECDDLLKQFDVAWPSHRDAKLAQEAQQARDQGEEACKAHHYSDGVKSLHRALHDIGVKPVKLVAPART